MSVTTRELLPLDLGQRMAAPVRQTLADLGVAANHAAAAVAHAASLEVHHLAAEDNERALRGHDGYVTETAATLAQCTLRYHDQLLVGYAIITARYAAFAARVAHDVTSGRQITDLDVTGVLPSHLIEAPDRYLPPIRLAGQHGDSTVLQEQESEIAKARDQLTTVIRQQLFGTPATQYDFVAGAPRATGSQDLAVAFPVALHDYAATVTWAIGVLTSADRPGTA